MTAQSLLKFKKIKSFQKVQDQSLSQTSGIFEFKKDDLWEKSFDYDFSFEYVVDKNDFKWSISKFLYKIQYDFGKLELGRKVLNWSPVDTYWNLGSLNSSRKFHQFDKKQEGLLGAYLIKDWNDFSVMFLFSYLNIPQNNPSFSVKNKVVQSTASWVNLPPTEINLSILGKERMIPIHYFLKKPPLEDLVLHPTLGARISFKNDVQNRSSLFLIYKPEPQIRINSEAYYDLKDDDLKVIVHPHVNSMLYMGFNHRYSFQSLELTTGIEMIDPETMSHKKKFESKYFHTISHLQKNFYAYSQVDIRMKSFKASLHYLHYFSEQVEESQSILNEFRVWNRVLGVNLQYTYDNFFFKGDFKYDFIDYSSLISFELEYRIQPWILLGLGGELLKSSRKNTYWSPFKYNDLIYTSLQFIL